MSIRPDSTIVRSAQALAAEVGEDTVLMSVDQGLYLGLDAIAGDIWKRLAQPCRVDALCAALLADYDAEPATLQADVTDMLVTLAAAGLIEVRD